MTVQDAIDNAKIMCDDQFDDSVKWVWLHNLDLQIKQSVIDNHNTPIDIPDKYSSDSTLIMPPPYNEAYSWFIQAQSCLMNSEVDEYNNAMSMCQSLVSEFRNYWNSTHLPKTTADGTNKIILW